jgi:hypothetical protein
MGVTRRGERMRKIRLRFAVGACAVVAGIGAASATAGERTGTGQVTPIASYTAGSICAFSGLEDYETPIGQIAPVTPGTVQHPSPGDLHGGDNACKGFASAGH